MMAWILLALLFLASPSWAEITHHNAVGDEDQVNSCTSCSATATWGGGTCANGYVVVATTYQDGTPGQVTGATYNGNAMTALATHIGAGQYRVSLFGYALGASGDTTDRTVAVTTSEELNQVNFHHNMYCGVDQATPVGTVYTANGTTEPETVTVADSTSGDMVVDAIAAHPTMDPLTKDASQTERTYHLTGGNHVGGTSDETATGANTVMSWSSGTNANWGIIAVALQPAPDATFGPFRRRH
jgi:hypothetical protein